MKDSRKDVLLRAAYDLLYMADEDGYKQVPGGVTVRYDDANCDGYCLMEDIASELGFISGTTEPIPLEVEPNG